MPDGGVEIRPPFHQYSRNARKNGGRIENKVTSLIPPPRGE
jgi:hypothetical protein